MRQQRVPLCRSNTPRMSHGHRTLSRNHHLCSMPGLQQGSARLPCTWDKTTARLETFLHRARCISRRTRENHNMSIRLDTARTLVFWTLYLWIALEGLQEILRQEVATKSPEADRNIRIGRMALLLANSRAILLVYMVPSRWRQERIPTPIATIFGILSAAYLLKALLYPSHLRPSDDSTKRGLP